MTITTVRLRQLGLGEEEATKETLMQACLEAAADMEELCRQMDGTIRVAAEALKRANSLAESTLEPQSLSIALEESVKLQSHYASILNQYDGGQRLQFDCAERWLRRLALLGIISAPAPAQTSPPSQPAPS